MSLFKRIARSAPAQAAAARLASGYLRLVWRTGRFVTEPADALERLRAEEPVIAAMWHGQHFLVPLARDGLRFKVMITRHRDGDLYAAVAERLGVVAIRGSGDPAGRFDRKGGVPAFKAMVRALREGWNITLTADVPKVARVAGLGVVRMAQVSGRPIYPVAVVTRRRIELSNWDRTTIGLPFSRGAVVVGEPIRVPREADGAAQEALRRQVEAAISAVTARAYAIVGATSGEKAVG